MSMTCNFCKIFLTVFIIVLFTCCTRTTSLQSSINSDTLKPSDIETITASSAPHMLLSVAESNPTYFAEQQAITPKAKLPLKSIKEVHKLKKAIKSNSLIPKSENYKKPKKSDRSVAITKMFFGALLVLLGVAGLIMSLFPNYMIAVLGNVSFPISVIIAMLSGFSIIGGIMLFVNGLEQ